MYALAVHCGRKRQTRQKCPRDLDLVYEGPLEAGIVGAEILGFAALGPEAGGLRLQRPRRDYFAASGPRKAALVSRRKWPASAPLVWSTNAGTGWAANQAGICTDGP